MSLGHRVIAFAIVRKYIVSNFGNWQSANFAISKYRHSPGATVHRSSHFDSYWLFTSWSMKFPSMFWLGLSFWVT